MFSAYLQRARRFSAIRAVAGRKMGAEALILTRSLLSMTARAAYGDAPNDPAERKQRFLQWRLRGLRDEIATIKALAAAGFDVDPNTAAQEEEMADIGDVGEFPDDTALMRDHLDFSAFHARVYRPSSDHVHFSQRVALDAVRGAVAVDLDARDPELADEALRLAILTYGRLLELSERAVRHGLTSRVLELVRPVLGNAAQAPASRSTGRRER